MPKFLARIMEMDTIYHNSSLNRRRMQGFQPVKQRVSVPVAVDLLFE
ncbi:MAG: hypothetical protein PHG79_11880 [Methanosarcina sp.]|nr:hypothetical protein [Methanosarcina sp.]MDD4523836.1 hypothetical protein [Methanosarcina sp.]